MILELERIEPDEMKSEKELWDSFEKDRPQILGCIFQTLAGYFQIGEDIDVKEKIRLADFHIACVRVGEVLGISEKEVSDLLWENQKNVNRHSLDEDIVACCLLELMSKTEEYVNSMTGLLRDLGEIANNNSIVSTVLPKTPNHLTIRMNKIKSNLQAEYGITYNIANVGAFKQITIQKNRKPCESCEKDMGTNQKLINQHAEAIRKRMLNSNSMNGKTNNVKTRRRRLKPGRLVSTSQLSQKNE